MSADGCTYALAAACHVLLLLCAQIQRERSKQRAVELGLEEIDRVRPIPDPQDTGLIKGKGAAARAQARQDSAEAAAAAAAQPQNS